MIGYTICRINLCESIYMAHESSEKCSIKPNSLLLCITQLTWTFTQHKLICITLEPPPENNLGLGLSSQLRGCFVCFKMINNFLGEVICSSECSVEIGNSLYLHCHCNYIFLFWPFLPSSHFVRLMSEPVKQNSVSLPPPKKKNCLARLSMHSLTVQRTKHN